MAAASVTFTEVRRTVFGNKRVVIGDLAFADDYATGGISAPASLFGLSSINFISFSGVGVAADEATANALGYDYGASKIVLFEGSAAGTALSEKTNAEAVPTGMYARCMVIGH